MDKEKGGKVPRKGPTKARHGTQLRVIPVDSARKPPRTAFKPGQTPGPGRPKGSTAPKNPIVLIEDQIKRVIRELRRRKAPMEPPRANSIFMGMKLLLEILQSHGVGSMIEQMQGELERLKTIVETYKRAS